MPRKQTIYLLELMDQGLVSRMSVAEMCLSYMSEDDVKDMMRANDIELLGDEDEE
jgi:hypothetical protein